MTQRNAPILRYTRRIADALGRAAAEQDHLTLSQFVDALGQKAHRLLLLVVALLNMIPGPPGFGGTIAWTTCFIAVAMLLGRPIRLPRLIGDRKLPADLMVRAGKQMVKVAAFLARFSRPRLRWMTGASATIPYGLLVVVVSVVMALPIPLINAIPNVGLCVIAFSMLNRDGAGVVFGAAITFVGLVVAAVAIMGVLQLGGAAIGMLGWWPQG